MSLSTAITQHKSGDISGAETRYRELLTTDPDNATIHHMLGVAALQLGRFEEAAESLRRAIALDDSTSAFHSNLSAALLKLFDWQRAAAAAEKALEIQPNFADALANRGLAFVVLVAAQQQFGRRRRRALRRVPR